MARGTQLEQLLADLRAEARLSPNPAHNTVKRDEHVRLLDRVQDWLYDSTDWPHLRVTRTVPLQAGQHIYAAPEDMDIERIESLEVSCDTGWRDLTYGIDGRDYSAYDPTFDERSWPVRKWQLAENEMLEVWPKPDRDYANRDGLLRVTGIKRPAPLLADDDRAELDDQLIVLYAAAEILTAQGARDARNKLAAAEARKRHLAANWSKKKTFSLSRAPRPTRSGPRMVWERPNG